MVNAEGEKFPVAVLCKESTREKGDSIREKGVSGGYTVRNSAEGAVRFLRRRTKNIAPSAMRPSTATAPIMPPAIAPALE